MGKTIFRLRLCDTHHRASFIAYATVGNKNTLTRAPDDFSAYEQTIVVPPT